MFPKIVVPAKHPNMIIFSRKTQWLLGTTILENPHLFSAIYKSYGLYKSVYNDHRGPPGRGILQFHLDDD